MRREVGSEPPSGAGIERDQLYDDLRRRIIHLDLPPGTRLAEQGLAEQFGVSRTPIRRVIDRLAHEGLVTLHRGSGASVSYVDLQGLREVWALRLKISELVGDFVRVPAPPEVIDGLEALLVRIDGVEDARGLAELYDDYHGIMLKVLDNGTLCSIYDQLYAQTARVFVQSLPRLDLATEKRMVRDEIVETLDASRQNSGQRLAQVRTAHMQMLLQRLADSIAIA